MHNVNQETVTLKLSRSEVIRLCMACTAIAGANVPDSTAIMWANIHDKVRDQLEAHDKKAVEKGWRE